MVFLSVIYYLNSDVRNCIQIFAWKNRIIEIDAGFTNISSLHLCTVVYKVMNV